MKQILLRVGQVLLVIYLLFVLVVFTYTAYTLLDQYNIGADNS